MAMIERTTRRAVGALFPTTGRGGKGVRVTPGAGGHNLGTPRGCEAKRAHSNVRSSYRKSPY